MPTRGVDQHKILVVDDDSEVLEITAELVRSLGYRTVTASDAFQALDVLRNEHDIEAMLSDVRMPGMDGEKLALAAQALRPDLQIVLTSGANWPRRNFIFLAKPYRVRDLEQALQHGVVRA